MGKTRIIAETGAGQHGVATATAAALFGLPCEVFMGALDVERQALNVFRMQLLGARVVPVESGSRTLKDAMNEALRDWVTNVARHALHHRLGRGPAPVPRAGARLPVGHRHGGARADASSVAGRLPDAVVACVGGGSNAMGIFSAFVDDPACGSSASRRRATGSRPGKHGASLAKGAPGVLHGSRELRAPGRARADRARRTRSARASTTRASGPELAHLKDAGRLELMQATDDEALEALQYLARTEGIIPALETRARRRRARARSRASSGRGGLLVVNVSGRGDKDVDQVRRALAARAETPRAARPARRGRSAARGRPRAGREGRDEDPKAAAGASRRAGGVGSPRPSRAAARAARRRSSPT